MHELKEDCVFRRDECECLPASVENLLCDFTREAELSFGC